MDRKSGHDLLQAKVDALKAELPCISFGYLGNYERWGDDTSWYIFLPHYGRIGKYSDMVGIGAGRNPEIFNEALADWDRIEAHVRRLYAADPDRIGTAKLNYYGQLVEVSTGQLVGLGIIPPPKFESVEAAAEYLRSYNTPVTVVK